MDLISIFVCITSIFAIIYVIYDALNKDTLFSIASFKVSYQWILLTIGIGLLFYGYIYKFEKDSVWALIIPKFGEIVSIGVLLGFLSNHKQITNSYKKEIFDIIYEDKFLKTRKDIESIWEKVSKIMFKSKFPKISGELLKSIKEIYFPVDQVSYYNDYDAITEINWASDDHKFIIVKDKIYFDLLTDSKDKFIFPLDNWITIDDLDDDEYYTKLEEYKVNGKDAIIIKNTITKENNKSHLHVDIELKGCEKYEVTKIITKKYSVEKDFHIGFRAKYITNRLAVKLIHPKDMDVCFIENGTINDFLTLISNGTYCEYKYKGLILPRQGYFFILKPKQIQL